MVMEAHQRIVDLHGKEVEKAVNNGEPEALSWMDCEIRTISPASRYNLTDSEEYAMSWIKEEFGIDGDLRRASSGCDFVYGNVGFEVKSSEWYELSAKQLQHARMLKYLFVIHSRKHNARVMDVLDRRSIVARQEEAGDD